MDRNRKMLSALILAVFLAALIFSGWRNFRSGIYIGDRFFYRIGDNYYKSNSENYVSISSDGETALFEIMLDGEKQKSEIRRSFLI